MERDLQTSLLVARGEGIVRECDGDVQTAIFKMIVNKDLLGTTVQTDVQTGNYSTFSDSLDGRGV